MKHTELHILGADGLEGLDEISSPYAYLFPDAEFELIACVAMVLIEFRQRGITPVTVKYVTNKCFSVSFYAFELLKCVGDSLVDGDIYVDIEIDMTSCNIYVDTPWTDDVLEFAESELEDPDFVENVWKQCVEASKVDNKWVKDHRYSLNKAKRDWCRN